MTQESRVINQQAAARRIRRHIAQQNGGGLPRSAPEWRALCLTLGIPAGPLSRHHPGFTARLFYDERLGGWLIAYRVGASESEVCRMLCHELAEWIAIQDYPMLFDGLPNRVYAYTGGDDPRDARHRIAVRVEGLCFRR